MRLTLRTMLAFLDDVLEGPDAKELGQKIDESKFASDLVHRIRSSVRRLRLGAPKVDGKGMGADANSVAEYLDNTMPHEQFPEFEKVCLESDVHLAEVAACHQVLTIVLGEPAAIDPAMRDRIYRIGHGEVPVPRTAVARDGNGAAAVVRQPDVDSQPHPHPHPAPVPRPARPQVDPERSHMASVARSVNVPDDSGLPLKSLALTLALGFIVAVVALRAIAPFNKNHPVWRLIAGEQIAEAPVVPATETKVPDAIPATTTDAATRQSTDASAVAESSTVKESTETAATKTATEKSVEGIEKTTIEKGTVEPDAVVESSATKTATETEAAATVTATTVPPKPTDTTPAILPPVEPAAAINVGRYISEEQILTRLDPEKSAWMVLPSDTPILAGEQLLSLPTYRPQIVVSPSVKVTLAGEAFLRLQVPDATNVPHVSLDFGRALLIPVGDMGNSLQLDLAGRRGQLTFADSETAVAIEVRPYLPPGADPMTATPSIVGQLWVTTGAAEWREPDREPLRLEAGQRGQFVDEAPIGVVPGEPVPDWVEGKNLTDIDRRASQELRKFLTTDRPLVLSLMEQTNYRQIEVRALACRCLCYLDIFEPAIAALGDSQHRSYWYAQLAAIQSTLPFGTSTVEKLQADIEKLHGADAAKIYRLLQGYSPEQLAEGGAADLVDALENESMTIRVLAFITLHRITDKTQLFRPEDKPEQEKSKVLKWRKALEEGQIIYKNPPLPLPPIGPPSTEEEQK